MSDAFGRLGLLDEIRGLAKKGASLEASLVTTFSLNGLFYEEVILRALERAGSRLNVLMVDAQQLAISLQDPAMRPQRAGRDYVLIPVRCNGAFHPKIAVLLSSKRPLVAVGSHNATDSGYARNDEVTVCWGHLSTGVPPDILADSLRFALDWAKHSSDTSALTDEVFRRLSRVADEAAVDPGNSATFIGWRPRDQSLLQQLAARLPAVATRIAVVSPFFDGDLNLLSALADRWRPSEIVVGLQPRHATLLRPELAPTAVRFVEFSAPAAMHDEKQQPPYLHGKVIAFETANGPYVVVGSANASAPAWLQGDGAFANAEAVILLEDDLAVSAWAALGLDRLVGAPTLSVEALSDIAIRSRERQRLESEVATVSAKVVSAMPTEGGWLLPGLVAAECRSATLLGQPDVRLAGATFSSRAAGVELSTGADKIPSGTLRIDGDSGPIAFAVLNDAPHLRSLLRPREAGQLLSALGRIDEYEGFEELFDLFERHVLESEAVAPSSRSHSLSQAGGPPAEDRSTPGPRGISTASLQARPGSRPHLEKDDFVADFLKALIRDLGPPATVPTDGDAPDIDEEELDEKKSQPPSLEAPPAPQPGEWERLVTGCRKRIGVLIGRLGRKLSPLPTDAATITSLAGKVLTVMCLLQRLRQMPPREGTTFAAGGRSESLVAASQLRSIFKIVMRALYSRGGLAEKLESGTMTRGSEDRRMLDAVMLWAAREVGVDFDADAPFNEDPQAANERHQDRVDGLVAAISAAAHGDASDPFCEQPVRAWADAPRVRAGWMDRHMELGSAVQARLAAGSLPTLDRSVAVRDIVVWSNEPLFPRLVASLSPTKATVLEPGEQTGAKPLTVQPTFLRSLDFAELRSRTQGTRSAGQGPDVHRQHSVQ